VVRRARIVDADVVALVDDLSRSVRALAGIINGGAPAQRFAAPLLAGACDRGGYLAGLSLAGGSGLRPLPPGGTRGALLLRLEPLAGAANLEVGLPAGTIFSVLRREGGRGDAAIADLLQPGTRQLVAGYVVYGPTTMLVVSFGQGAHGFTLDPVSGELVLTHPGLRTPGGGEVSTVGTLLLDVHRVLLRGGMARAAEVDLVHVAAPLARLVEQAGGAAITAGGRRVAELVAGSPGERAPLLLGVPAELERPFRSPLFGSRSLFSEP
jgi:fructose-1,6-bisphosphatase